MIITIPALIGLVLMSLVAGVFISYTMLQSYFRRRATALLRRHSVLLTFSGKEARDRFLNDVSLPPDTTVRIED